MGWRTYGEPEPEESPAGEFFCWLFLIGLGFPINYGWIFVALGWMDGTTLIEISAVAGALIGSRMAWQCALRKKQRGKG